MTETTATPLDQPAERGQSLTVVETAELLSVSPRTVRRLIASGALEARRIGPKLIRIDARSVADLGTPLQYRPEVA